MHETAHLSIWSIVDARNAAAGRALGEKHTQGHTHTEAVGAGLPKEARRGPLEEKEDEKDLQSPQLHGASQPVDNAVFLLPREEKSTTRSKNFRGPGWILQHPGAAVQQNSPVVFVPTLSDPGKNGSGECIGNYQ